LFCSAIPSLKDASNAAREFLRKAMDRSDPKVVAMHTLAWNVALFAAGAYFIQKYGYKLAL
jgi:hypothetical protein